MGPARRASPSIQAGGRVEKFPIADSIEFPKVSSLFQHDDTHSFFATYGGGHWFGERRE